MIFNGVNPETFAPNRKIEKRFDWITVCRLTEIKRVDELINLAHELNRKLLIVGDGHLREALQEQSRKLSNVATFHGLATQEELPDLYNSSKFFVLNSEFEVGTPYALIEARSCGLVCIANELDGSSDVINDGVDGFLFRRDTSESLKKKLTEATNLGAASYEVFSEAARRSAQEFFSERFVYSLIYQEITR
jgi:glycosyltransferase involved in cell wall biosynthesis